MNMKYYLMTAFLTIIALIIAILTNILSNWIEPSLSKKKRLTIVCFIIIVSLGVVPI